MAEFYINTEAVTGQSARLNETGNAVRNVQTRVAGIISGLGDIGLGQTVPAVTALEMRLAGHAGKMNSLSSALGMSMLKYVAAESGVMGIPLFLNPDYYSVAGTASDISSSVAGDSVNAGLYDSEGNFRPPLGAGVEAEPVSAQVTFVAESGIMDISVGGSIPVRFTGIGTDTFMPDVWDDAMGAVDSAVAAISSGKDTVFEIMDWDNWTEAALALSGTPYCEVRGLTITLDSKPVKLSSPVDANYEYGSSDSICGGSAETFDDGFWNDVTDVVVGKVWETVVDDMGFKGLGVGTLVEARGLQFPIEAKPVKLE